MQTIDIKLKDCIIPDFFDVLEDIFEHRHSRYIFPGGRGSTKSSFIGIAIPMLITIYPNIHAVCFRKVGNTIQDSIFAQISWGIHQLGLEEYFKIPKTYSTPIEYIPTGQKIYFKGLDDPNKVKSIKPTFGYIGINWFEELDQYAGENELRKVTQSTKRGGDLFWDFRTFNPPISKNNWANELVEDYRKRPKKSTLVTFSNYLQVPEEWLGPEFLEEALELKEKNPKAYEHEYMGIPVGTGGDVFPNACDLDMTKPVKMGDRVVPLYKTFDTIYNGIDWGFAKDPFRYVKMHFDPKHLDLYIYDEYNTVKTRNEEVFHALYDDLKKVTREELVIADSAEEKSIADFRAYGAFIRGADKGPESVRYGIKWLQGLNHIYIDARRCPETYTEFTTYEYEQDKDGNFISAYPDENNHSIDATRYAMQKYANRRGN
jgi:PBSX family phage terminase large subunit